MSPESARLEPPVDLSRARELRRLARELHPDLGGDPAVYVAAVAEVEARHRTAMEHGLTAEGDAARRHTPSGGAAATSGGAAATHGRAGRVRRTLTRHTRRLRHRWRRRSGSRWIEL